MLLKPLAAAIIMGAVAVSSYDLFSNIVGSSRIPTIVAIALAGLAYIVTVLLVRGFKREDIMNMPKGEKIASILTKYKLL